MTSTHAPPALFAALVDDAALFPPGEAPMPDAVAAHRSARDSGALLPGRFVVPTSRIDELLAELEPGDAFELALVVDSGVGDVGRARAAVDGSGRATVGALEARVAPDAVAALVDASRGVEVFAEVPRDHVGALAGRRAGAKFRTGGLEATAFPSEAALAEAIVAAVSAGVRFKCTAGLHHAVRHTDQVTGFEHHGFLNVVLATWSALHGAPAPTVAANLGERDAAVVAESIRAIPAPEAPRIRTSFAAFGSCSLDEPEDDLRSLGLLR